MRVELLLCVGGQLVGTKVEGPGRGRLRRLCAAATALSCVCEGKETLRGDATDVRTAPVPNAIPGEVERVQGDGIG
jgi:hypothetical protein